MKALLIGIALCVSAIAAGMLLGIATRISKTVHAAPPATVLASAIPAAATSSKEVTLPILVYHIVRPRYPNDTAAVKAIAVTPDTFDAELGHLQSAGYHVVGFHALETYFASSTPLPSKPVIISIDDGWEDQYQYAFPLLEKYHDTATFFVFTNAIGRKGFLTWEELHAMLAAGMTIGDHTMSHPYLLKISDPAKLWQEIDGSKLILESHLGIPITEFAYPFGEHNAAIVELVQKAGYLVARGDYWSGFKQSSADLYDLNGMNAPTTTAQFITYFP